MNLTAILRYFLFGLMAIAVACQSKVDPVEKKIEDLLAQMSLEEKVEQLSGDGMNTPVNERLGIPPLRASDGPFGSHGEGPVTAFPTGSVLSATWNLELMSEVGAVIGKEAKARGVNLLLGPCVNMSRHPLGGRNFESYGEDPYLSGALATAYISGMQAEEVAACVKHYAVNNQEWYRHFYSAEVDERTLREIYLPAFEAAVKQADVWSVMTAYNKVNGVYSGEHNYLMNDILKDEWGFRGITIPDWTGAHSTVEAAEAGLDVIVYGSDLYKEPLLEAVKSGELDESVLDEMVRRTLRVKELTNSFGKDFSDTFEVVNEHTELAIQAAREGIVLLKNEEQLLPLKTEEIKKIAVIGPNAATLRHGGGGSSHVGEPTTISSPLEAITELAADIAVEYAEGVSIVEACDPVQPMYLIPSNTSMGTQGLWGTYFNNRHLEGEPVFQRLDSIIDFKWGIGPPIFLNDSRKDKEVVDNEDNRLNEDNFSVRWTGQIEAPKTGPYSFVVATDDGVRVYLDNELIIDNWWSHDVEYQYGIRNLVAGRKYDLKIEYYEEIGGARMSFGWQYHDPAELQKAVSLAQEADAVVVCAGLSKLWEAEAYDRISMDLPSVQTAMIDAILEVNPETVVVLNTSGSITKEPWMEKVKSLIQSGYPGQGGSEALAEILYGKYNPSGKLTTSMIASIDDFPPAMNGYQDPSLNVNFSEGVFMGYRYHDVNDTEVVYPFGHGLSYTEFSYDDLQIEQNGAYDLVVTAEISNTGQMKGAESVQLYVGDVQSSIPRPKKELKGFAKVELEPGESKRISIALDKRSFAFYDVDAKDWIVEKGTFNILLASSARDIRLTGQVELD